MLPTTEDCDPTGRLQFGCLGRKEVLQFYKTKIVQEWSLYIRWIDISIQQMYRDEDSMKEYYQIKTV